jgi:twitching motility protein PilT
MTANKLLYVLSRPEVKELSLEVGHPARALVNDAYRRITPKPLTEEEVIALLAEMSGRAHLLGLPDGCSWTHEAGVGPVRVRAGYEGSVLKAFVRLEEAVAGALAGTVAETVAEAPVRRRSKRPPAAPVAEFVHEVPRAVEPTRAPSVAPPRRASKRPPSIKPRAKSAPAHNARANSATARDAGVSSTPIMSLADAFNFDPSASPWAERPSATEGAPAKRVLPKFEGDALDDLFGKAREQRASDLHLLADRPPMLRVAAELVAQDYVITEAQAEQLILPRVPARARAVLDREGSCDFALVHPAYGRFRANVTRQRTGLKLTARPIGDRIPTLAELGLPESIGRATEHHQGLIVITGPTGHGKTTTLNAIVGIINRERRHHVITVEDPVEYIHPTAKAIISQREVGTHTKSFAAALKGSLREDPDVIVVGELRDTETVRMALSASETGHLVISTMNTPSAAKAIERMIDLFPPGDQPQVRMTLAGGLRLIVSQRLLPNTDRTGLVAAAEILPGNMPLWNLIRENRTYQIASLQQRGKKMGIVRLDESLAQLVRSGRTTIEIAKPLAEQPEHFDAFVAGRPIIQAPVEAPAAPNAAMRATNQAVKAGAEAAAASSKKAADIGKSMLSRAGKLFGNEG